MNYSKIYDLIIENRQQNPYNGYVERHHIVPRCLGGSDEESNLVALTAREHFICHILLAKMYLKESNEWYKMNYALSMMQMNNTGKRYFNSHLYSYHREQFKEYLGKRISEIQTGSNNSQYGTMWISNNILKETRRISKDVPIPIGWIKGRNTWLVEERRKLELIKREKVKKENKIKREAVHKYEFLHLYDIFVQGSYSSIREFSRSTVCKYSQPTLVRNWKLFVPDFNPVGRTSYKPHVV